MNRVILGFSPIFYPHMGGAERTVFELYSRLIKRHGYKIYLVTINTENAPEYEVVGGIEVFRVGKNYKNKIIKYLMFQFWFLKIYLSRFRRQQVDLINVHYAFPLSLALLVLKIFTNKKIVISEYHFATGADIHSGDQNPGYVNKMAGLIYRLADLVLVISQDNRRYVKEVSGVDKAVVIKQGTDHEFFSPKFYSDEKRVELLGGQNYLLVTTSRISPRKNLEDMVGVVKYLVEKNLRVKLVINGTVDRGYSEYEKMLKQLVVDSHLENFVYFNGFVPEEDLRVVYACADLFLLTSKYEGFGIANVEAMSSGVPVITYDTGAARDFIIDGENGYVTDNNPSAMAIKVSEILNNQELIDKMKLSARKCVEEELNWDHYADLNHNNILKI